MRLEGCSILVIDDDASTREVVAAVLERADADVRLAASAEEGWIALREQLPDLIIADLGMPVQDGFSFIRRVRESGSPTVPAIALSAYADARSQESAIAAGFTAFLAKPARSQALLELAGSLLDAHRATRKATRRR